MMPNPKEMNPSVEIVFSFEIEIEVTDKLYVFPLPRKDFNSVDIYSSRYIYMHRSKCM